MSGLMSCAHRRLLATALAMAGTATLCIPALMHAPTVATVGVVLIVLAVLATPSPAEEDAETMLRAAEAEPGYEPGDDEHPHTLRTPSPNQDHQNHPSEAELRATGERVARTIEVAEAEECRAEAEREALAEVVRMASGRTPAPDQDIGAEAMRRRAAGVARSAINHYRAQRTHGHEPSVYWREGALAAAENIEANILGLSTNRERQT